MQRRTIAAAIGSMFLITIAVGLSMSPAGTIAATSALAQPTTSVPTAANPSTTADLESRVATIETEMARIDSTQSQTIDQLRFLLTGLSILLTAIVAIQAFFQFRQGQVQHAGVDQVSKVMDVVTKTLQGRLTAEEEARKETTDLRNSIQEISNNIAGLLKFRTSFEASIRDQRREIEQNADSLAKTPRHDFRLRGDAMKSFARQFDDFTEHFQPIEEESEELSAKAYYIRGIAAHYANDPKRVKECLQNVTQTRPDDTEPKITYDKRVANAYYYLGITESNFMTEDPAASFREATTRDPDGGDFLTRVVAAEASAMRGKTDDARTQSRDIVSQIDYKYPPGSRMFSFHRRLRSRAILVQANVEILEGNDNYWEKVQVLLEPVLTDDSGYYYATVTMAQIHVDRQPARASDLFRRAYASILRSYDLPMVTEVRSAVLLRMAAGLCCRQTEELSQTDEHLERADQLLENLPRIGSEPCTVFSVLSKRNESKANIKDHLRSIRAGQVLLPRQASS